MVEEARAAFLPGGCHACEDRVFSMCWLVLHQHEISQTGWLAQQGFLVFSSGRLRLRPKLCGLLVRALSVV